MSLVVYTVADLCVSHDLESLLLKRVSESLANLNIEEGANTISVLEDGHFSSESGIHTTKLEANNTTADDGHFLRDLLELKSTSGADNVFLVKLEARGGRQFVRLRAGSNNGVLDTDSVLATIVEVNTDLVVVVELTPSLDVVDIVLLEKVLDATGKAVNTLLLGLHELREVESDRASVDTEVLKGMLSLVELVSRVEESLGGNAANVEAGTAESATLLNADSLHAFLTSLDGSDVAAGTATNYGDVVLAMGEGHARELHEGHGVTSAGKHAAFL